MTRDGLSLGCALTASRTTKPTRPTLLQRPGLGSYINPWFGPLVTYRLRDHEPPSCLTSSAKYDRFGSHALKNSEIRSHRTLVGDRHELTPAHTGDSGVDVRGGTRCRRILAII